MWKHTFLRYQPLSLSCGLNDKSETVETNLKLITEKLMNDYAVYNNEMAICKELQLKLQT